jgi:hydrogenase maturation factor
VKLAGANPELASSPVLLETIFDEDQIERILDERKRAAAGGALAQLLTGGTPADTSAMDQQLSEANVLKAKADALGVLRRAGVDAQAAAKIAGLENVKFIPGNPITIKEPGA